MSIQIETYPVTSSNVGEIGYDKESQTLAVRFNNGALYHYTGVPQNVYDNFANADSIGKYLNAEIKDNYSWDRVS